MQDKINANKIAELFEEYRREYLKEREAADPQEKTRRRQDPPHSCGVLGADRWRIRAGRGVGIEGRSSASSNNRG